MEVTNGRKHGRAQQQSIRSTRRRRVLRMGRTRMQATRAAAREPSWIAAGGRCCSINLSVASLPAAMADDLEAQSPGAEPAEGLRLAWSALSVVSTKR